MNAIISSTKFDGSLHYQFDAQLVSASGNEIRVYTPPGCKAVTYRGEVVCTSHALRIFYTDRPWNMMVRWFPDWRFENHYVNIAEPATWDGHVLRWVDLDLDIIHHAGAADPMLDDEDEFARHRVKWGYPQATVDRCWRAVEEVYGLIRNQSPPFDQITTRWRPPGDGEMVGPLYTLRS
jgi:protein associated with RNAse G/E